MNLKNHLLSVFKSLQGSSGLAQIPIILGLLLMAVAVPAAMKLAGENQTNQGKAAVSEPCKICWKGDCINSGESPCSNTRNECSRDSQCPQPRPEPTEEPPEEEPDPTSTPAPPSCNATSYGLPCAVSGWYCGGDFVLGSNNSARWCTQSAPPTSTPQPCGSFGNSCCFTEYVGGTAVYKTCESGLYCSGGKCGYNREPTATRAPTAVPGTGGYVNCVSPATCGAPSMDSSVGNNGCTSTKPVLLGKCRYSGGLGTTQEGVCCAATGTAPLPTVTVKPYCPEPCSLVCSWGFQADTKYACSGLGGNVCCMPKATATPDTRPTCPRSCAFACGPGFQADAKYSCTGVGGGVGGNVCCVPKATPTPVKAACPGTCAVFCAFGYTKDTNFSCKTVGMSCCLPPKPTSTPTPTPKCNGVGTKGTCTSLTCCSGLKIESAGGSLCVCATKPICPHACSAQCASGWPVDTRYSCGTSGGVCCTLTNPTSTPTPVKAACPGTCAVFCAFGSTKDTNYSCKTVGTSCCLSPCYDDGTECASSSITAPWEKSCKNCCNGSYISEFIGDTERPVYKCGKGGATSTPTPKCNGVGVKGTCASLTCCSGLKIESAGGSMCACATKPTSTPTPVKAACPGTCAVFCAFGYTKDTNFSCKTVGMSCCLPPKPTSTPSWMSNCWKKCGNDTDCGQANMFACRPIDFNDGSRDYSCVRNEKRCYNATCPNICTVATSTPKPVATSTPICWPKGSTGNCASLTCCGGASKVTIPNTAGMMCSCGGIVGTAVPRPTATNTPKVDSCGTGMTCKKYAGSSACYAAGGEFDDCSSSTVIGGNCCVPSKVTATPTPTKKPDSCGTGMVCKKYASTSACYSAGGEFDDCSSAAVPSGNCCVPSKVTATPTLIPGSCVAGNVNTFGCGGKITEAIAREYGCANPTNLGTQCPANMLTTLKRDANCKCSIVCGPVCGGGGGNSTPAPTSTPGSGGGGNNPTATPTKSAGVCTGAAPADQCTSSLLRVRPACVNGKWDFDDQQCNKAGRTDTCGGKSYCCPSVGGVWTTDMSKCNGGGACKQCPTTFGCYVELPKITECSADSECNGGRCYKPAEGAGTTPTKGFCVSTSMKPIALNMFRWFAPGYQMQGFTKVNDWFCAALPTKPRFLGKTKGDANCDGSIDVADYTLWQTEYGAGNYGAVQKPTWESDFTGTNGVCDGKVDVNDYTLWQINFNLFN